MTGYSVGAGAAEKASKEESGSEEEGSSEEREDMVEDLKLED